MDVYAETHRILSKNARYDITIDSRGSIGVTKWIVNRGSTYPHISSANDEALILADGTTLNLPKTHWTKEAAQRWRSIKAELSNSE